MERDIRRRYKNLQLKGSFSGLDGFIKTVKPSLSRRRVRDELLKIRSYALHQPLRKNFPRRRVYVGGINEQWGMDLVDIQKQSRYNNNMRFILCVMDIFSKKAWLEAIPNKTAKIVAKAIKKIIKRAHAIPKRIQFDKGKEFLNLHVKNLLKSYGISSFSVESEKKCCTIERFIRTIFGKIQRYMTHKNTRKFVKKLPQFEDSYNSSYHRSIGMSPNEVNKQNEEIVYENLYNKKFPPMFKKPKFKVGDKCLVAKRKTVFEKGYAQNYFDEVFYIKEIRDTVPHVYVLQDVEGEEVQGTFYEQQLKNVNCT